jgi:hypothetical protein
VRNRVDEDSVKGQLKELIVTLETEQSLIDASFEKLLVAITNVLRLTDAQKGTLASLQGSPKELQRYLIDMISQIREKTSRANKHVHERLVSITAEIE